MSSGWFFREKVAIDSSLPRHALVKIYNQYHLFIATVVGDLSSGANVTEECVCPTPQPTTGLLMYFSVDIMNILAIIAHPDDLEIAAAGTICQLTVQGHRVLIGVVTDEADLKVRKIRQTEALQAALVMGVPSTHVLFVGQEDRYARNDLITCELIQRWMRSHVFTPDIVITHSSNDTHQDHRAVHDLAAAATRDMASLYLYAAVVNSLRTDDFLPSVFVDTSRSWSRKKMH